MTATSTTLTWEAPGKGDWRGLHDHFPRALTPEYQLLLRQGIEQGEATWMERYGMPVRTLRPAFIHGRVFITAAPLMGPATNRFPPAFALKLALKVVPVFRKRVASSRRAVADRVWLEETRHWYDVERAEWQHRNALLAVVDPAALEETALVEHLCAARDNVYLGYREHFRLHGPDLIPICRFVARATDWGIDPVDATALLAGSSPASTGAGELPPWRIVTGYDLDERTAAELPIRPRAEAALVVVDAAVEASVRARVPASDQGEWDELLADARATYGLRDDNGLLTAAWPAGLLRRAMLEVGRRLTERGAIADPSLAVELTVDELVDALTTGTAAATRVAAARLAERRRLSEVAAPPMLGVELVLPMHALPPAMRTIATALITLRELGTTPRGERQPLRGAGIGTEPAVGRACVAHDPTDAFTRFEPGDIIITAGTCPAWNTLLASAGGVVTEEGGPLSHAAVIARELGIPALIGTARAMERIPDGATVEIDPVAGLVRVIPHATGDLP
ncbi:MAG: rifampicin phosphotransferase [Acidimicrobiaceae bacterium]